MGEIHMKMFPKECPRTVENLVIHSKKKYYDNIIFHRVINHFMIQTGDLEGTGCGGEYIWGDDFEDEFNENLKHDKPFMVSMANSGPNTNGSQFFITCIPTPWLDNKHTVFGQITKGMDVVQEIEKVEIDEHERPLVDVKLYTIKILDP